MRIAITMNITVDPRYGERRDSLSHDWSRYIYGLMPGSSLFPLPNQSGPLPTLLEQLKPDGVIFSNGNDWGTEPDRDAVESLLVEWCLRQDIPMLGVCRGLQSLNAILGGTIVSDLKLKTGIRHGGSRHLVNLCKPEFAELAGNTQLQVNSFHNQGVMLSGLSDSLEAFALAEDGNTVEAFHHRNAKMLAIQWHPERESPSTSFDGSLITSLFCKGRFWQ